jgi:hypothetical protein
MQCYKTECAEDYAHYNKSIIRIILILVTFGVQQTLFHIVPVLHFHLYTSLFPFAREKLQLEFTLLLGLTFSEERDSYNLHPTHLELRLS